MSGLGITFEIVGVATALSRYRLSVPLNQRPYAWEDSHVTRLFQDLSAQIAKSDKTYFLGTIVLAQGDGSKFLVADGQQRLATTSILIAAIRDYLYETGVERNIKTAEKYTSRFLLEYDEEHGEEVPKLELSADDRTLFRKAILLPPGDAERGTYKEKAFSHQRLLAAAKLARKHVEDAVTGLPPAERASWLFQWIKFLESSAKVIAIQVPEQIDAFKMFETLNDRGLRASQIDILKNFLFSLAKDKLQSEVQPRWASMVGIIESVGDDELLLDYVRHFWIMRHGPIVEEELAESFEENISGRKKAVEIVNELEDTAADYVALLNPLQHPRFTELGAESRAFLAALTTILKVRQIRPLLLAILKKFHAAEARRAFDLCLSWSVRFLIAGGGGAGVLDKHYGLSAKEVFLEEITSSKQLAARMAQYVPNDVSFQQAFRVAQVTKTALARYYLHSIENYRRGERCPQIGYFELPEDSTNLEHIMPAKPNLFWNVSPEDAAGYYRRIGNMTLLSAKVNSKVGDVGFLDKIKEYQDSTFLITQELPDYGRWGPEEIAIRQDKLAELAPKVWPIESK